MLIAENIVYLWLLPVVLQVVVPLFVMGGWTIAYVLKKGGTVFAKQNPLIAQPT